MNDEFFQRQLRRLGVSERIDDAASDFKHKALRKARRQSRGENATALVHAEAAGVQLQQRLGSFEEAGQEAHNVRIFFMRSRTSLALSVFFQPTQRLAPPF